MGPSLAGLSIGVGVVCVYVGMYMSVWLRVMPGVYSRWWDAEGRAVKGLTNLCACALRRALLAVHVHSVTLRGG